MGGAKLAPPMPIGFRDLYPLPINRLNFCTPPPPAEGNPRAKFQTRTGNSCRGPRRTAPADPPSPFVMTARTVKWKRSQRGAGSGRAAWPDLSPRIARSAGNQAVKLDRGARQPESFSRKRGSRGDGAAGKTRQAGRREKAPRRASGRREIPGRLSAPRTFQFPFGPLCLFAANAPATGWHSHRPITAPATAGACGSATRRIPHKGSAPTTNPPRRAGPCRGTNGPGS